MSEDKIKSLIQLNSIISILPNNKKTKIPAEILEKITNAKLDGYIFKYNYSKDILEQNINDETKEMLFDIYIKYLATKEELDIINKKLKIIEKELMLLINHKLVNDNDIH